MAFEFTDQNFDDEVRNASGVVVVDFWAEWCPPCRQLAPIIEQLAHDNPDVKIGKMNVDQNQSVPLEFGISNIPTIIFFKDGRVVETKVGAFPKSTLQGIIDQHVAA
ncbi:MAG TPA: thioredoxin [Pirellulaceae bacterium]|nr:thioredoxin [Pirellulaceae bacterium]